MNLNFRYDKEALMALINSADSAKFEHNLVIDFDGEVILDPEVHFPNVDLGAYKFTTKIKDKTLHSNMMVTAMYDALEIIFDKLNQAEEQTIGYRDAELSIAA